MVRDRRPDTDIEKEAENQADADIEQPLTEKTEVDNESGGTRRDEERLKENREQLGVEDDHKTPDMKKGHRGTFP